MHTLSEHAHPTEMPSAQSAQAIAIEPHLLTQVHALPPVLEGLENYRLRNESESFD